MSSSDGRNSPAEEAGLRRQADSDSGLVEREVSTEYNDYVDGGMYCDDVDSDIDSEDEDYVKERENLNNLPIQDCEFVEDEEYLKDLGLKVTTDTSDAGMNKIVRAHLLGAFMADGVKMKEGMTPQELNSNFNIVTYNSINLEGLAELVVSEDEGLMKCRENASNVLMLDRFKDMVKHDLATGKYTPILKSEIMEKLAEDVYRTAKANETRKDKDEKHKMDGMEKPECRKKYMTACDMLVQIMMICYIDDCKNMEESKISWHQIRASYERMFDTETPHEGLRNLYHRYKENLDLDSIGGILNKDTMKPLFGRGHVKKFLSCPIYSKIQIDYEGQMMLYFNPKDIKNRTFTYTADDYQKVDEEIERSKTKTKPNFNYTSISKADRQKQELEDRRKNFVPFEMPIVHVPKVDKPTSVFGGKKSEVPERVEQDYAPPSEEEAPVNIFGGFGPTRAQQADYSDDDSGSTVSSDAERPVQAQANFTEDEENDQEEQRRKMKEQTRRKEEKRRHAVEQKKREASSPPPEPGLFAPASRRSSQDSSIVVPTAPDRLGIPAAVETVEEKITSDAVASPPEQMRLSTFVDHADEGQDIADDLSVDELFTPVVVVTEGNYRKRPQMPNEQHHLHMKEKDKEQQKILERKAKERKEEERRLQAQQAATRPVQEEAKKPQEAPAAPQPSIFGRQKNPNAGNGGTFGFNKSSDQHTFGSSNNSNGFGFSNDPPQRAEPPRTPIGLFASKKPEQQPKQEAPQQPPKSAFHPPPPSQKRSAPPMPSTAEQSWNQMPVRQTPPPPPQQQHQSNYHPQQQNYPNQGFATEQNYGGYQPQQDYRPQQDQYYPQDQYQNDYQEDHYQQEDFNKNQETRDYGSRSNHSQDYQEYQGSNYGRSMSPPRPQLGSTRTTAYIGRRAIGTQSEPVDALIEELLGGMGVASNQDPNAMRPRDQFLNFIKWHVFVFRDHIHAGKRIWTEIQKDLPQPLNDPEKLLGPNWEKVIEEEVPQIEVSRLRRCGIVFEWGG